MFVLGLITCVALRAFSAQARVVDSFEECKEFFYQGIEPSGMDQNAKKICQMLENRGFYYATLYSVHHKIPLYSAYILDPACSSDNKRTDIWHLEPQISQSTTPHMVREDQNTQNLYKGNQAISSDYSASGYDRGHLNPSSFQCSDGRTATFTLTNAAPMKERFNRVHWNRWERTLRSYLIQNLIREGFMATAFIVTGTVPDPSVRIPQDRKKVTVPSHIWTAVCFKHYTDDRKSFSFGYIGRNQQEEPGIKLTSVSELNNELKLHFGTNQPIRIFGDDCFGDNNKLVEVQGVFQKLINLVNQAVQTNSGIQDMYLAVKRSFSSDSTPEKKVKVNENTGKVTFDSMSTYYNVAEDLKAFASSTCLITYVKPVAWKWPTELKKREVSAGSDAVECLLVSENQKTAADGSVCSSFSESDYSCRCNAGGQIKLCCTSPCHYMNEYRGYGCYSDQKLIGCSTPYSRITVNGEKCLDDYPCATYGYDYYWCWTAGSWDYCSPPRWNSKTINGEACRSNRACAKYGYEYKWCYTDDEDNWDYC